MSEKAEDESDRNQAGTLDADPKSNTAEVAADVPRVRTVRDVLAASGNRALSRDKADTYTTGHYKLDQITGGFQPSFAWLFGADTSWGKSSFLISLCDENIRLGRKCLIVSSEDSEEIYGDRLMARRTRVDALAYRDRRLTLDDSRKVTAEMAKGEQKPFYISAFGDESAKGRARDGWPLEELLPHLGKLVREQQIGWIGFDYIQEFSTKKRFQDERLKYKWLAGMMRRFIRVLKIRGCIFSQLTVTSETKIPTRANIRECRDIANGSDVILLGFEPDVDVKTKDGAVAVPAGQKCVSVDKVKNGPRGAKIPMQWDSHSACFDRVDDPEVRRIYEAAGGDDFSDVGQRYP
jgi:replicative DNA helicase